MGNSKGQEIQNTEFKQLEKKLNELKNSLENSNQLLKNNQEILDAHNRILEYSYESDLNQLLKKCLDEIEILTESNIAFFHFIEDDQTNISLQTWSTNTELRMCNAEGDGMHYPMDKAGIWADAVRFKKPVIHNDYANEKNKKGMPEGHATVVRELIVPIIRKEKAVGVLGVGNKKTDYTDSDVNILQKIADFTWEIAIQKKYNNENILANKKWQSTFDGINDPILLLNSNGNIIHANKSSELFFKLTQKELIGQNCSVVFKCDQNNVKDCPLEKVKISRKRETDITIRLQKSLEVTLDPIFDHNNEFKGAVHIINDITDRLKTQNALQDSETFNRTLFKESSIGLALTEMNGRLVDINPAYADIIGYSMEETLQLTYWDITPKKYFSEEHKQLESLEKTNRYGPYEKEYIHKKGHLVPVRLQGSIVEKNGLRYIWSSVEDISSIKNFSRIQESMLEIAKLSVQELNMHDFLEEIHFELKKIVRADNFYVAIYHKNKDTYTFPYHIDEFDEIDLDEEFNMQSGYTDYVRVKGKGQLFSDETKDVSEKYPDVIGYGENPSVWLGVPLKLSNGDVYGVLAIQDYSNFEAYTEVELNLMEIIAQNIGVFIERVSTYNELQVAKENAEESDRLKSSFLANMSHEIRTPMNGILGFTELLKEPDNSAEEQQQYIDVIERNGNRMLTLISDLIDISKIESGQVQVIISPTDINEQIENIYTLFKAESEKKGLILEKSVKEQTSTLFTDQEKLFAILANLVKNAIKYSGEGTISVGYQVEKDFVKFHVKDTGIGIPKEKQDRIFDRFVQADSSLSSPYEGAGLGLAICKAYIELLEGKIWVESELNSGAHFYFTIPK